MSRSWDRVADEQLERRLREGVAASPRFWVGFLGTLAFMVAVTVVVSTFAL